MSLAEKEGVVSSIHAENGRFPSSTVETTRTGGSRRRATVLSTLLWGGFVLAGLLLGEPAEARTQGELLASRTCATAGCHDPAGGPFSPSLRIEGPETVGVSSTNVYTLIIEDASAARAGFFIEAGDGVFSTDDDGVFASASLALTHAAPREFAEGSVSWQFSWRAPATTGTSRLDVAALASNGFAMADQVDGFLEVSVEMPALRAAFSADPVEGVAPLSVQFVNSTTGGVPPYSSTWGFGDETSSAEENPVHTYETAGEFNVELLVTDDAGDRDSQSVLIVVSEPLPELVAGFTAEPDGGSAPLTVQFSNTSSGGVDPLTFDWEFGDGEASQESDPEHVYDAAGTFRVVLTAADADGTTSVAELEIVVEEPPELDAARLRLDALDRGARSRVRDDGSIGWSIPTAGVEGSFDVELGVVFESNLEGEGIQAWSFSLETASCISLLAATTDGTLAAAIDADPPGLMDRGFESTQIIDPMRNDGRQGLISAIVLGFREPIALDPIGEHLVLRIRGEMDRAQEGYCETRFVDESPFLRGGGQPVALLANVDGVSVLPAALNSGFAPVDEPLPQIFLRGDADPTGELNLSDGVRILLYLFQGGSPPACMDAADVDDNSEVNLTDPVYLLNWLFQQGPPLPAPSLDCGEDPTDDELSCGDNAPCA